jgi:tRNA(Ile)-lysidine synthetase-like protein
MQFSRAHGSVEAAVLRFLRGYDIPAEKQVLVAYSGGPDSTALLAALVAIMPVAPRAIHFDHGIRDDSEREREIELVRRNCRFLGNPLTVARIGNGMVKRIADREGEGIESAARRVRYHVFRSMLEKKGAERLFLAHTRDDQLETILMRLLAGSGMAGLRGILAVNGPYCRPFLGLPKSVLIDYLSTRGIGYSLDSSNSENAYLRNRFRNILIPVLAQSFPGWERGLAFSAEKASLDAEALEKASKSIAFAFQPDGSLATACFDFFAAPEALRIKVLVEAIAQVREAGRLRTGRSGSFAGARTSFRFARAALECLSKSKSRALRGGGIELRREDNRIILRYGLDFPRRAGYFIVVDRPCRVRVGPLSLRAAWVSGSASSGISAEAFSFPLVVRSRRPGDTLEMQKGAKRIDELLSEWRIKPAYRGSVPVIEDRDGIVAILGAAFGGRDRFRSYSGTLASPRFAITVKGV